MPNCEKCGKAVNRRVTFVRGKFRIRVCKDCADKLELDDYKAWVNLMVNLILKKK